MNAPARKVYKKSGFKNFSDTFWVNERSVYGCRYLCKFCGKESLGMGDAARMHYSFCQKAPTPKPPAGTEWGGSGI